MRRDILVAYDISDPARLRKVFQIMRGYGDHIQYSVFRCALSRVERMRMVSALGRVINHTEDQVLLVDLGVADAPKPRRFRTVGRPYGPRSPAVRVF